MAFNESRRFERAAKAAPTGPSYIAVLALAQQHTQKP